VISETTVRPKAAFWHPCHRGIRESIHIRRAVEHLRMDSLRVVEQLLNIPWRNKLYSSYSLREYAILVRCFLYIFNTLRIQVIAHITLRVSRRDR